MKQGRRTAARQLLLGFGLTSLTAASGSPSPGPSSTMEEGPKSPPPAAPSSGNGNSSPAEPPPSLSPVEEGLAQLLRIRRLHIESLSGGEAAGQIRDMIIAAFQSAGFFMITENAERADAFLRGTAEDLVFTEQFNSGENLTFRSSIGAGRGSGASTNSRNYERNSASMTVGQNEHTDIKERKHEAVAAVRIVSKDGDVLWSTTQESLGAKFRGASADVAEKITRQLRSDIDRAKKLPAVTAAK